MEQRLALVALALVSGLAGCGDNIPLDPQDRGVAGAYVATVVTNTRNGTTIDLLKESGLIFTMSLKGDGTMTGQYLITTGTAAPGNAVDIHGTWTVRRTTLTLDDTVGSFISQVPFTIVDGRLEGIGMINQAEIRIVLQRQAPSP